MVFFNCGACGQGLKKAQIEKHLMNCNSNTLSCIDCSTDFNRKTYTTHTKCISEAKKYESKNFVEKSSKGELKQNAWLEVISNLMLLFL